MEESSGSSKVVEGSNEGENSNSEPIRNDLVETAAKFLQNPKVEQTPLEQRRAFLFKKGLTRAEVDLAVDKSGTSLKQAVVSSGVQGANSIPRSFSAQTTWKDYANVAIIISGASYGVYHLFRKWVMPKFFGVPDPEQEQMKHLQEQVDQLQNNLKFVMDSVQQTLNAVQQQQGTLQRTLANLTEQDRGSSPSHGQMQELKTEIGVVKSLLLSRNQFPPLPKEVPSVPAWQLSGARSSPLSSGVVSSPIRNLAATTQNCYEENGSNVDVINGSDSNHNNLSEVSFAEENCVVMNGPGKKRKSDLEAEENDEGENTTV